jgi:hypothetical protein
MIRALAGSIKVELKLSPEFKARLEELRMELEEIIIKEAEKSHLQLLDSISIILKKEHRSEA